VITLGLMLHLLGWLGTLRSELFRGIHPRCFISTLLISLAVMLLSVLPNERRTIGFTAALALVLQITGVCSSSISIQRVFASIRGARARRDGGAPADLDVSREYVPVQDIWVRELIVSIYCICVVVFGVSALYVLRSLLKHRCTRYTLESVWSAMGVVFITYASYSLVEAIVLPFYVSDRPPQIDALQTFAIVATLVTGVGMLSVRARARLMGWVAARCESSSVAVHMAMLMGGGSVDVMRNATSRLRAVSAELLKPTDLAGDLVARDVFLRSRPAHIGEIDVRATRRDASDANRRPARRCGRDGACGRLRVGAPVLKPRPSPPTLSARRSCAMLARARGPSASRPRALSLALPPSLPLSLPLARRPSSRTAGGPTRRRSGRCSRAGANTSAPRTGACRSFGSTASASTPTTRRWRSAACPSSSPRATRS
jgi:hypothetical protein